MPPQPASAQVPDVTGHSFQAFDLRKITHNFIEKSWVIVLSFVIAAFWTARTVQKAPVLYSATAMLQYEPEDSKVVNIQKVQESDFRSLEKLQTMISTFKTTALLEMIVTNGLSRDPVYAKIMGANPSLRQQTDMVKNMTRIELRRGTFLIDVTAIHTDPQLTAVVANAVVNGFIAQNVEKHYTSTEVANEFLLGEASRLKKKLQDSELALQAYKEKTGAYSVDPGRDAAGGGLAALNTSLTQVKTARAKVERDLEKLVQLGGNMHELLSFRPVAEDPAVVEAQRNLSRAESDLGLLQLRYRAKHPRYVQADAQIREAKQNLTNAVLMVPLILKSALETAKNSEQELEKSVRQQETVVLEQSRLAIPYNVLLRDVESDRALYESVLKRLKETGVTKELQPTKLYFAQRAEVPGWPFSPDKKAMITSGLAMGLAVGLLLAFGLNCLDNSIKTVDQAEEALRLPVLAVVPLLRELRKSGSQLIPNEHGRSLGAEAFRTLRAAMSMLGPAAERRVFLFTSALPQEGKTFTSLNFAASLAQQSLRTVIIDCDLRRPSVEDSLGDKGSPHGGVTDYLTGQKGIDLLVHPTKLENLFFISAGTTAPNPAELLARGTTDALIDEALARFDRVVIDSAPIHAVSDTLLILARVQTVCIVARAAKTPCRAVQRCIQMLHGAHAPLVGIVLNRMPRRRGPGYYYDTYYDYSYHGKYAKKGVYGSK